MSASDMAFGYPVHAVKAYRRWTNQHGDQFTDWLAFCGHRETRTGHGQKTASSARRAELCPGCWSHKHQTYHPDPIVVPETEETP